MVGISVKNCSNKYSFELALKNNGLYLLVNSTGIVIVVELGQESESEEI
jgi:hypothetical protein